MTPPKGVPVSEDQRRKLSDASRKNNPMKRPEVAAKVSAAHRGRKRSDEARANMSAANRASWRDPEVRERRAAPISRAMKGNPKVSAAATARNKRRYCCAECGMESSPGGIGRHQRATGHSGRVSSRAPNRIEGPTEMAGRRVNAPGPDTEE